MQIDIQAFLNDADVQEELYPGKKIVKPCKIVGGYKNHCVVIDWRDPREIKIDVRPGLTGQQIIPEVIKEYPVCLQNPTSVKITVGNVHLLRDDDQEEDDSEDGSRGKSGSGGGQKPIRKKLEDIALIAARFGDEAQGNIPKKGEITDMVVMGVQIAKEAFGNAFATMTNQIKHAHISATEILSQAADFVKRVTPPSYVTPKGDETINYKYDRNKNADIGMRMSMG